MDLGKISEDRLFQNNSKEEVIRWSKNLHYFHYMRDRGGHNCEGDSFCVYFRYEGHDDLTKKLAQIGVSLNKLEEGFIAYDPFESYTFDDLEKLKNTIPGSKELEQPQYVEIAGHKVHIWVMANRFEISVSGSKDGKMYQVSEEDFNICLDLEKLFDKLDWQNILEEDIKSQPHCVSEERYPELF